MRTRSLAAVGMTFGLASTLALLASSLQAGEVVVDPAAPPAPPAPRPIAPFAPSGSRAPMAPPVPEAGPEEAPRLTREQLRELVGPVALYPDVVLSSLLPASTAPIDVVQAARWLASRASPDEVPPTDRGWDPSVLALLQFPELVQWLDENLEWLEQLGFAMTTQPGDVLAAIQEFREMARASGALATNGYQQVVTREVAPPADAPYGTAPATIVCIEPVEPQVVYVPIYDPVVVIQPVYVVEPVVCYSSYWTFSAWGPCAWHDLSWGWPSRYGWWGGGIWVHDEPWHCGRPRPNRYVSDAYGPSRWSPSRHASRAYAPRTASSTIARPGRPVWDARSTPDGVRESGAVRSGATSGGPTAVLPGVTPRVAPRRSVADGAQAARTGASTWSRRGIDLPSEVTSRAKPSWSERRRDRSTAGSAPRVTPALPSIPPALESIPPSLPGTGQPSLGMGRPSPALGGETPEVQAPRGKRPGLDDASRRYAPRSRTPVVVRPTPPKETILREPAVDTPAPSIVLPPTSPAESRRSGRSSWRRAPEASVETPTPPVTTTPRALPAPSRAPSAVEEAPRANPPAPRTDARASWRTSRNPAPRAEPVPPTTDTPRSAPDRSRWSGAMDRAARRFDGAESVPTPPRRR